MDDDISAFTTDVNDVVRATYIYSHVQKLLDILDEAESIYSLFPKVLKKQMECEACGHDVSLTGRAAGKLALAMAQLSPDVRDALRIMLEEVGQHVGGDHGELDYNDMRVIEEMVGFVQKVGSKSTRHLLTFLEAVNEGEPAYLLIRGKGRDSEVRMAHNLPSTVAQHFEI